MTKNKYISVRMPTYIMRWNQSITSTLESTKLNSVDAGLTVSVGEEFHWKKDHCKVINQEQLMNKAIADLNQIK